MAEFINETKERMLPEYEMLKRFDICTDEQLKDCIRKREGFQLKLMQSDKSMRDYIDYIIFERKVHKWVTEKERTTRAKLTGLKARIVTRICNLYRQGLRQFPHEERFWQNFLQFAKKSIPQEVSGIYEKMLTYHGDKPEIWCEAALWAYEYNVDMTKVKGIFFRALSRHVASEIVNKTFFDILLLQAEKIDSERRYANNTISEQDVAIDRVLVVYNNSKANISNINFFLSLVSRCEEERFREISAPIQKQILTDIMQLFPREEILWDALAQRELQGLNMNDLKNVRRSIKSPETIEFATLHIVLLASSSPQNETENSEDEHEIEPLESKNSITKIVWQKRTLKRRIELCCNVYQAAVRTLETTKMWTYYINAMLKLNQDMTTQQVLKRKCLAAAFKEGHSSGKMSAEHYVTFVRMLLESPNGLMIADSILREAINSRKCVELYELWLSAYIGDNNLQKAKEIFQKAREELGSESFPLWRLILQFYKTRYDECIKLLQKLYKEACQQTHPKFGVLRAEYLEFCVLNVSISKARDVYDELCHTPPPCLELYEKMAELESQLPVKTAEDFERCRLCHENAVHYFGKENIKVWIDFIVFERTYGNPKHVSLLCKRAKYILAPDLVDSFVFEYTLLTTCN